jgi:hypothetical protein
MAPGHAGMVETATNELPTTASAARSLKARARPRLTRVFAAQRYRTSSPVTARPMSIRWISEISVVLNASGQISR